MMFFNFSFNLQSVGLCYTPVPGVAQQMEADFGIQSCMHIAHQNQSRLHDKLLFFWEEQNM